MSATVAAALKKIAVALLTDKKVLKTIGGIVLGIIIVVIMPIVAVASIFNGDIHIDTERLQQMVVQNLSAEETDKLQFVEDTMVGIENAMTAAGFDALRAREAQVLYVLALSDYAHEADFISKLVGCFAQGQSDAELIAAVNTAFGTDLSKGDEYHPRRVYLHCRLYRSPQQKQSRPCGMGEGSLCPRLGLCVGNLWNCIVPRFLQSQGGAVSR